MRIVIIHKEIKDRRTHTYIIDDPEAIDLLDRLAQKFTEKQTKRTG